MTRQFKFRVWHKPTKLFLNHCSVGNGIVQHDSQNFTILDEKDCVVQQCTGVKDKYGVEIYEGDILSFEKSFAFYSKALTKVVWEKAYSGKQWCEIRICDNTGCEVQDDKPEDFYGGICEWKIVVGNIFEGIKNESFMA